ncbi:NAD(P)-binding protein [Corynespora cassiicola Philippines]|uniref:NAD(P)-binding protein n=1 Tax=Corynespora cassiicola Philippines TaxID=1448308 RepID=A0A2T2N0J9_CORCC|nr:NAD(P)-binding protein [Corynespora cassiicola Philippines]
MTSLKSIAVVGASGNLGQAIVPFLIRANFNVTAICRSDSTASFAENINVIKTEYTLGPLTEFLKGQDVVLCVLDPAALAAEAVVIDAATSAGVKWFIPSEFGHNTADERVLSSLPLLKGKTDIVTKLESKKASGLNWVGIVTGLFFDWCLSRDFLGFNIKEKTALIWDEGDTKFHSTNIGDIGMALVNLLSNPGTLEKVKNTYVYISSFEVTQNEILLELERATGTTFQVRRFSSEDMKQSALKSLAQGDRSAVGVLLQYVAWGNEGLGHFDKLAQEGNAMLLRSPQESLKSTIKRVVKFTEESYKAAL